MRNYTKGYKAFDKGLICRGFQFEEGKEYFLDGEPVLCENGFHFCKDLVLTLEYYPDFDNNEYAEVEAVGDVVYEEPTQHKCCTNRIRIVRVISREELLTIVDGNRNSGNDNSGYGNSGHGNSGDWNACDYETGAFNSEQSDYIRVFNKPCLRSDWENARKPDFLYFDIDATIGYKASLQKSFESADAEQIAMLKALPNFDADVFFEISGIRID